jgi:hypothetical protein
LHIAITKDSQNRATRFVNLLFVLLFDSLFLEERSDPEDAASTNDSCGKLTQESTPRNAKQREQPSAERTAEQTKHDVHNQAESATFHQLASAEASQTTQNK